MKEYPYTQKILNVLQNAELNMCKVWVAPNLILQVESMGADGYRFSYPNNAIGYIHPESVEARLAERADRVANSGKALQEAAAKNCVNQLHELLCAALNRANDQSKEWGMREIDMEIAQNLYARKNYLEKVYLEG